MSATLAALLFATIFGRYTTTVAGEAESVFEIRQGDDGVITVHGELYGVDGHQCWFGSGPEPPVLDGDVLRVPYEDVGGSCVLILHFSGDKLTLEDPDLACRRAALCGARVGFDGWELTRECGEEP